jgi:hypothetical protein
MEVGRSGRKRSPAPAESGVAASRDRLARLGPTARAEVSHAPGEVDRDRTITASGEMHHPFAPWAGSSLRSGLFRLRRVRPLVSRKDARGSAFVSPPPAKRAPPNRPPAPARIGIGQFLAADSANACWTLIVRRSAGWPSHLLKISGSTLTTSWNWKSAWLPLHVARTPNAGQPESA